MKIILLFSLLLLTGCEDATQPVRVDSPELASSLKWLGTCGVICSAMGATALVLSTRRRK